MIVSAITHLLAAMAGGALALGGYAVVKVGSDQEHRYERRRGVERLLMEYGELVDDSASHPVRLDAHRYAELIMREVGQ